MQIRGKFQLQSVKEHTWGNGSKELTFGAMYDPTIPEDQKFSEATPSASATMTVKRSVAEQFTLGTQYYVDFTPAE